jgi:hypothetical protein
MRSPVPEILRELLREAPGCLSLDQIGEAIGTRAISTAQIEELLDELGRAGVSIEQPRMNLGELLREVLLAARLLRAESGRAPTTAEIALRMGKPDSGVRAALLFGSILGR